MPSPKLRIPRRWLATLWMIGIGLLAALITLKLETVEARLRHNHQSVYREDVSKLDTVVYDWLFQNRGPEPGGIPEVVIVAINDNAIANISDPKNGYKDLSGQTAGYPFPRSLHAQLIRKLAAAGARVIGMDILFSGESDDPREDRALADALKAAGNVVLAANFTSDRSGNVDFNATSQSFPAALFRDSARAFAPVDLPQDTQDSEVRRFDLTVRQMSLEDVGRERDYPCFSPLIAALYQGMSPGKFLHRLQGGHFGGTSLPYYVPDLQSGPDEKSVRICFAGYPSASCPVYGYDQVLDGSVKDPHAFQGKIVLVGSTLKGEHDVFPTPLMGEAETANQGIEQQQNRGRPGVEIHANIIHTLLARHLYASFPDGRRIALVWACSILVALLTLRLRPLHALFPILGLIAAIFALTLAAFNHHVVLRPTQPLLATVLSYGLGAIFFYAVEERRANETRRRFGRYVGPSVLDKVLDPDFAFRTVERRYVTMLFSDVNGFTTLSEKMDAKEAVALLNRYLDTMVALVFKYGGTLDKIMGDGLMAYFGAPLPLPEQERRAVECALDMQNEMKIWREASEAAGLPPLKIRIGIHAGEVVVGEVGAESQVGYTVIGDAVNTAARLEPLNKETGTEILISEAVQQRLPPTICTEFLGEKAIRGREEGIRVYSVTGRAGKGEASA